MARHVYLVAKDGEAPLNGFECYRLIAWAESQAAKAFRVKALRLSADQIPLGSTPPKVGTVGMKELSSLLAKQADELLGIAALESCARKLQQKALESLLRVRRLIGRGISVISAQSKPSNSQLSN
jgi:hypothetical protein